MNRSYEDLQNFYKQSPPRDIDKRDFSNSSPLAKLLIILGTSLSAAMLLVGPAIALTGDRISLVSLLILACIFMATALLALTGILSYKKAGKLLRSGLLSKGTILSVKALPARLNEKSFYKVKIKVADTTNRSTLTDTVDNYALDYFLDARDCQTPVDVLVLPGIARGLLLYKLHVSKEIGLNNMIELISQRWLSARTHPTHQTKERHDRQGF